MISVIIPTLNEQRNIYRVISQFKGIKGIEIIVADGSSNDDTIKIAKSLGAKIFQNQRNNQNIAKNRNLGAKHAIGEIMIFCDADTRFENPKKAIKEIKKKFENKELVAGMCVIKIFPEQEKIADKIYLYFYNRILKNSLDTKKPTSSGQCQIIRKSSFDEVKGYPEIKYQEDTELFRKLNQKGKLHYFSNIIIYESPRRYRRKGYLVLGIRALYSLIARRIFHKEVVKKWERVD
jgi:glycosyltransferase involved in cell wall biosynthesis